jgi:carbonic anhydrase
MSFVPHVLSGPLECEAVIITCIDFRFQRIFDRWLRENFDGRNYNRVAYAGAVKDWQIIFPQIEFSYRVHHVRKVVLVNHEDCRAYGSEGTLERQLADLRASRDKIWEKFPELDVALYYARLAGHLEQIR